MKYDETNVTRGIRENGENPGYFYAPCKHCNKRLNVGNYPPVIVDGKLDVFCHPSCQPQPSARELIHSILHDAAHKEMEQRGVPKLADESIALLTAVMMLIRYTDVSTAQILAVLRFTLNEMDSMACEKCKELSLRICAHMAEDFKKYMQKSMH